MSLFDIATRDVPATALEGVAPAGPAPAPAPRNLSYTRQDFDGAFDAAGREYGVDPDILRGMATVESGFAPDVISGARKSPMGAVGLMQFIPGTSKRFGINPLDPVESIFGAAAYMRENLDRFGGDYEKAVAAYNTGENRKALGLPDWMDRVAPETRAYVGDVLGVADKLKASAPAVQPKPAPAAAPARQAPMAAAAPAQPEPTFDPLTGVQQWALPAAGPTAPAAPDNRTPVGVAESFGRGWGQSGAQTAKTLTLAAAAPVVLMERLKNSLTGSTDTSAQDAVFRNLVDPTNEAVNWYALKPDEKQGFLAKVSHSLGGLAQDLPMIIASGGAGSEAALAKIAPGAFAKVKAAISHGFDAMRPLMIKSGTEKAEQVLENGGTVEQAMASASTAAMLTGLSGAAPLAIPGGLAKRIITGLPVGAAQGEVNRQVQNLVDPANVQQPFDLEQMGVGAVTNAALAGAMGPRAAADRPAPQPTAEQLARDKGFLTPAAPKVQDMPTVPVAPVVPPENTAAGKTVRRILEAENEGKPAAEAPQVDVAPAPAAPAPELPAVAGRPARPVDQPAPAAEAALKPSMALEGRPVEPAVPAAADPRSTIAAELQALRARQDAVEQQVAPKVEAPAEPPAPAPATAPRSALAQELATLKARSEPPAEAKPVEPPAPTPDHGITLERDSERAPNPPERFPKITSQERLTSGMGSVRTRAIAEGKPLYRETNASGLDDLMRLDRQFDTRQMYVADNRDLALGQGDNRGVHVEFRPDALSGREHLKPGTGDLAGREYLTDAVAPRAVERVTVDSVAEDKKLRGLTKTMLRGEFNRTVQDDGRVVYARRREVEPVEDPSAESAPSPVDALAARAEPAAPVRFKRQTREPEAQPDHYDRDMTMELPLEDGSTAKVSLNPRKVLDKLDARESALRMVRECLA